MKNKSVKMFGIGAVVLMILTILSSTSIGISVSTDSNYMINKKSYSNDEETIVQDIGHWIWYAIEEYRDMNEYDNL